MIGALAMQAALQDQLRAPQTYEEAMSRLHEAIGTLERLTDLQPDQIDRLRHAVIRLSNAERKASRG